MCLCLTDRWHLMSGMAWCGLAPQAPLTSELFLFSALWYSSLVMGIWASTHHLPVWSRQLNLCVVGGPQASSHVCINGGLFPYYYHPTSTNEVKTNPHTIHSASPTTQHYFFLLFLFIIIMIGNFPFNLTHDCLWSYSLFAIFLHIVIILKTDVSVRLSILLVHLGRWTEQAVPGTQWKIDSYDWRWTVGGTVCWWNSIFCDSTTVCLPACFWHCYYCLPAGEHHWQCVFLPCILHTCLGATILFLPETLNILLYLLLPVIDCFYWWWRWEPFPSDLCLVCVWH